MITDRVRDHCLLQGAFCRCSPL